MQAVLTQEYGKCFKEKGHSAAEKESLIGGVDVFRQFLSIKISREGKLMNKRILRMAAALMVCLMCLPMMHGAAASDDLVLITEPGGAILYDSYDLKTARPIALIPYGSPALYLAAIDWGYCVVFGNYAGYIYEDEGVPISSGFYEFEMPCGEDYSIEGIPPWEEEGTTVPQEYVPEFPYGLIGCEPLEDQIATRSGPNRSYTWEGNHSPRLMYRALYRTAGNGIDWVCVEFTKDDMKYRLYTGMWRLEAVSSVPYDGEEAVWACITRTHTPHYGPGYEYAECGESMGPCDVKAFYQENGWLMYEYTTQNGEIRRCWAPPGCWE